MFVIGTAGHVDHGKSTLIHALSGIDPDRLEEEKKRGMTIELGFAWMTLPSGFEVSIVDVPGHERFVKNMLMGVGGIDIALLIVSADEGVMPQTKEHLDILDLLNIDQAIVVLTKVDLVDSDWVDLVASDVQDTLLGTSVEGAPIVPVSVKSGEGLEALKLEIDRKVSNISPRVNFERPRLPVDRVFTMSGFGAVITGTLADGEICIGQEVELLPSGSKARVRGIQSHNKSIDKAKPGSRIAVNLGGIEHSEINRGDVLTKPGWLTPCSTFDAMVHVIDDSPRPLRHNHRLILYTGTSETPVTVRVLDGDSVKQGKSGWIQLLATTPVTVIRGDSFILRDTQITIAGGSVLEIRVPRRRRSDPDLIRRLEALAIGSNKNAVVEFLKDNEPTTLIAISRALNITESETSLLYEKLLNTSEIVGVKSDTESFLFSPDGWDFVENTVINEIKIYHSKYPLRTGIPKEELRSRLQMEPLPFQGVISKLVEKHIVMLHGANLMAPDHDSSLSEKQRLEVNNYLKLLGSQPYSPPTDLIVDTELVFRLENDREIVRCAEVTYLTNVFEDMVVQMQTLFQDGRPITIGRVREMFQTSRKYTLAFLEELDRRGITIRRGDDRFWIRP